MSLNSTIPSALARALEARGYDSLTEVQQAVLAEDAHGADLLVSAQTGSGKTVAFGLAMAAALLEGAEAFGPAASPLALVVAPTRELALQVKRELDWLYAGANGRIAECVGGMDPRAERRALLRGAHIVVGTPGRLRDHIERGALEMSALRAVVLDEADEMLDFGFREDLEFILDAAPQGRRTLLFSATVPKAIADIARRYQKDARRISTASERSQHADIEYRALTVAPSDRENAVMNCLRYYDAARALVFCSTREAVNRLASRFGNRGFQVVALSGEFTQAERTKALQALRDGRARVCVATDVAARGIDLPGLELVIHADLPVNADTLLHRSGRTGRAGRKGVCALIVPFTQRGRAVRLLRDARVTAEWGEAPGADAILERDRERATSDPALAAEYDEAMLEQARALLERYGPEQVAAAFLHTLQAALPPAEELIEAPAHKEAGHKGRKTGDAPPREAKRRDFGPSVWFQVNTGRKHRAEPRWLLPLICRIGHVTRKEVGAIEIGETATRFEIIDSAAERFERAANEAPRERDENIRVSRAGAGGEKPAHKPKSRPKPRPEKPHKASGKDGGEAKLTRIKRRGDGA